MLLHVVSMPATSSRKHVPSRCWSEMGSSVSASISMVMMSSGRVPGSMARRSATAPMKYMVISPRASMAPSMFWNRSEEHTSELQSLMRNSYAVFCLKKKKKQNYTKHASSNTEIHNKSPNQILTTLIIH